jgi:hypothetical protein
MMMNDETTTAADCLLLPHKLTLVKEHEQPHS